MKTRTRAMGAVLCAWLAAGCSTRFMRPPATPARVMPQIANVAPPLHEGEGQVTIDSTPRSARVELVTQRTQVEPYQSGLGFAPRGYNAYTPMTQYTLRPLCVTPCAVNLPLGAHELLFTDVDPGSGRTSTAFVNVASAPSVVRHALGRQSNSVGGVVGAVVMGALGFAVSLAGGMLVAFSGSSLSGHDDLAVPGYATLGVGVALGAGAVVLGLASRPVLQPGSTVQWTPTAE